MEESAASSFRESATLSEITSPKLNHLLPLSAMPWIFQCKGLDSIQTQHIPILLPIKYLVSVNGFMVDHRACFFSLFNQQALLILSVKCFQYPALLTANTLARDLISYSEFYCIVLTSRWFIIFSLL